MNFGELTGGKLLGVLVLAGSLGSGALFYTVFKSERDENASAQTKLQAKVRENAELEAYRPKLADIERQLTSARLLYGGAVRTRARCSLLLDARIFRPGEQA